MAQTFSRASALLTITLALAACGSDQKPSSPEDDSAGRTGASGGAGSGASGASNSSAGSGNDTSASGGVAGEADVGSAGDADAGESSCVPRTCAELGACGGQIADGCGHPLQCPACPDTCNRQSAPGFARRARSASFSGSEAEYSALFNIDCDSTATCVKACTTAGGTADLCSASECVMSVQNYCLTPPVWGNLDAATVQGTDPEQDGATLVLIAQPYHDQLLADRFQLGLPDNARIQGIEVKLRRASDFPASAADNGIHLIKSGHVGSVDRSAPEQWPDGPFQEHTYGGPTDLWGETWTPAALNAEDFGVAMSAKYTLSAGNARAYIDFITVKVYYGVDCDPTP